MNYDFKDNVENKLVHLKIKLDSIRIDEVSLEKELKVRKEGELEIAYNEKRKILTEYNSSDTNKEEIQLLRHRLKRVFEVKLTEIKREKEAKMKEIFDMKADRDKKLNKIRHEIDVENLEIEAKESQRQFQHDVLERKLTEQLSNAKANFNIIQNYNQNTGLTAKIQRAGDRDKMRVEQDRVTENASALYVDHQRNMQSAMSQ